MSSREEKQKLAAPVRPETTTTITSQLSLSVSLTVPANMAHLTTAAIMEKVNDEHDHDDIANPTDINISEESLIASFN